MGTDILDKSREYIQRGQLEKAQIILRRILNENPNLASAVELHGDLALKLGRNEDAIARYERACDTYTYNSQYAEAIICLEKILKIEKTSDEIVFRLADLYKFFGLPTEAIKIILQHCTSSIEKKEEGSFIAGLRKIVELQSKNLTLRLSFVKVLLSLDRSQEAQDELNKLKGLAEESGDEHILEEVKKLLPQHDGGEELDPKSRIELGNLLYEIGSKDEAIVEFYKAVSDLIEGGDREEAVNVLNRIIEIDPGNADAISKLNELTSTMEKPGEEVTAAEPRTAEPGRPHEEAPGETITTPPEETISEAATQKLEEEPIETVPPETGEGVEFLQDLSKEVEGFIAASEPEAAQESAQVPEDLPQLEGQIADIEFLLKEAEAPPPPTLEVEKEFSDFQKAITWGPEDSEKKLNLANTAYDAELYKTALSYIEDMKNDRVFWPRSLEIISGSWIKLGNYNEAIKILGQAILHEEIPETEKIELRYLLASAYESVGDFENALREIEHIMSTDPLYKDVREIYSLLGGTKIVEEPVEEAAAFPTSEIIEKPAQEIAPEEPPREEAVEEHVTTEEAPTAPSGEEAVIEHPLTEEMPTETPPEEAPVEEPPVEKELREHLAEKVQPEKPPEEQQIPEKETYPTVVEEGMPQEKTPEKPPEELIIIKKTENIAFL